MHLQGKQNRAQFTNWLCYELSGVCKSKAPPLPKDRKRGPAFEVMDPKEAEMEKMLAGMKACLSPPRPHLRFPKLCVTHYKVFVLKSCDQQSPRKAVLTQQGDGRHGHGLWCACRIWAWAVRCMTETPLRTWSARTGKGLQVSPILLTLFSIIFAAAQLSFEALSAHARHSACLQHMLL